MADPALEKFDRLRMREVEAWSGDPASDFLARFQSAAASLEPDEKIDLKLVHAHENMKLLKAVLADPQASKICSLRWDYGGEEDVDAIVPLLLNNCPELASLHVNFGHHSAFDFVSSVLEHPSNKLKVLEMPPYTEGDSARFFAALGHSQVSALVLFSDEFDRGLCDYLARDLLVRLRLWGRNPVPSEAMMSLAKCTRLAKLEMFQCEFSQPTAFPKSVTNLLLFRCQLVGGFDWSFLADSNVQELDFYNMREVDGTQLGRALAVRLRAKGLDWLHFYTCDFTNQTLAAVGVELGRIKILDLQDRNLDDASIALIALVLQSPNSEMKELRLEYDNGTMSSVEKRLVPALRHPNCSLAELSLRANQEHEETAKTVEDKFYHRRALFVLLQGQQVRRLYCPLRRLPVEMFRLVGMVLM